MPTQKERLDKRGGRCYDCDARKNLAGLTRPVTTTRPDVLKSHTERIQLLENGNSEIESKLCAICHAEVPSGSLSCPFCNSGVFETGKKINTVVRYLVLTNHEPSSEPDGQGGWLRRISNRLFKSSTPKVKYRSENTSDSISFGVRHISLDRSVIESGNVSNFVSKVDQYMTEWAGTRIDPQIPPIAIDTSGYENDPRELAVIKEVRSWFGKVHRKLPYLPVILFDDSLQWYFHCIMPIRPQSSSRGFSCEVLMDEGQMQAFFNHIDQSARKMLIAKGVGPSVIELVIRAAGEKIVRVLQYRN